MRCRNAIAAHLRQKTDKNVACVPTNPIVTIRKAHLYELASQYAYQESSPYSISSRSWLSKKRTFRLCHRLPIKKAHLLTCSVDDGTFLLSKRRTFHLTILQFLLIRHSKSEKTIETAHLLSILSLKLSEKLTFPLNS